MTHPGDPSDTAASPGVLSPKFAQQLEVSRRPLDGLRANGAVGFFVRGEPVEPPVRVRPERYLSNELASRDISFQKAREDTGTIRQGLRLGTLAVGERGSEIEVRQRPTGRSLEVIRLAAAVSRPAMEANDDAGECSARGTEGDGANACGRGPVGSRSRACCRVRPHVN